MWEQIKARYADQMVPVILAGLVFPAVSTMGWLFDVYDSISGFLLIFTMLWIGGTIQAWLSGRPETLMRLLIQVATGALVGLGIAIVGGARPDNTAAAVLCGAFAGLLYAGRWRLGLF